MLFNPCWSFYNVEEEWNKDTLHLKVNIQKKQEDGMCTEVIVNTDIEYHFKINKKGNYFITYLNSQNEEVLLPLKVK